MITSLNLGMVHVHCHALAVFQAHLVLPGVFWPHYTVDLAKMQTTAQPDMLLKHSQKAGYM